MREILFRGKRLDNGEWVYGDFVNDWSNQNTKPSKTIYNNIGKYVVIPETIGQYTGLTDKNGTKIFEGDIVKYKDYSYDDGIKDGVGKIKYYQSSASYCICTERIYINSFHEIVEEDVEVIGNIHDNPELLQDNK